MSEKIRLMATGDVAAIKGFEQYFLTAPLDRVIDPHAASKTISSARHTPSY